MGSTTDGITVTFEVNEQLKHIECKMSESFDRLEDTQKVAILWDARRGLAEMIATLSTSQQAL